MSSEHWKRIEQIYYTAIASPAMNRAALLDRLCSDDPYVRSEVESLLDARDDAGSFLSSADLQSRVAELFGESCLAGQTLDHYEILSAIGAGAMGEVYLARDTRLDRKVALKVLPAPFARDAHRIARFLREAKAASALNHPNIITIYDIGEVGDTWFIIAEFIEGITLRERLAAARMEFAEALGVAIQCTRALEAAHRAGIVHRDIKPENIMLRPDGLVKLVDFGLARMAEIKGERAPDATQAGAVIGTPRYMSPEQARGGKLDARSDIFSLGAVIYEAATGCPAFRGETTADVFAALLGPPPDAPSKCTEDIPAGLDAILSKALQREPEARYRTMGEFGADLERLKQQPAVGANSLVDESRTVKIAQAPVRRNWLVRNALTAAAALSVVVVGISYLRLAPRGNRTEEPPLIVVPLTSFEGYKDFASFSPDSSGVAFSWNGGAGGSGGTPVRNVYIKRIGSHEPHRLTFSAEDERLPVWSPDGNYIAFSRALTLEPAATHYAIAIVPSSGGSERQIAEAGMGVSWSKDGSTLALAGEPKGTRGISLLSLKTSERREITHPGRYFDTLPAFSPDGRQIAFTRNFGFSAREIFVISASGGQANPLTFDRQPTYGATWTADGREIVFASSRTRGGESLWRVAAKGGIPHRVSVTLEGSFYPSISRDGNKLVYTQSFKDTNIYAYEGPGFALSRSAENQPLIASSHRDDSPSISPDGTGIAFVSKRTGNEEIWLCHRRGNNLVQLTSFNGPGVGTPRWSPDGRWIAFDSLAAGNPNIYIIGVRGGPPRQITTGPHANFMPSWSPDGKWIYFKSDRSGSAQIWKMPAAGGSASQVTYSGASEAFASPDGKLVYFTKRPWSAIWSVPVDGGSEKPLPALERFDKIFRSWGVLAQGIYFISREDTPRQTIRFYSFDTGRITKVMKLDKDPIWDYPDIALSNDGRLLLTACLDQEVNDLMLIENFR
ncbi:MAG TPA: protein kinase [Bryobacteraceae bacterium]|nr:protein kinase [Bryobacteraceae bacterium]